MALGQHGGSAGAVGFAQIPVAAAVLHHHIAVVREGHGQLAVRELIVLAVVVGIVDVTNQVVILGNGLFGGGHIAQGGIPGAGCQIVVLTVHQRQICGLAAAVIENNIFKSGFKGDGIHIIAIDAFTGLGHGVAGPGQAVAAVGPGVGIHIGPAVGSDGIYAHTLRRHRHLSGGADGLGGRIEGDGDGTAILCHGQRIIAGGPCAAPVLIPDDLEFICTGGHIGVDLFIDAGGILHHVVGIISNVPVAAAQGAFTCNRVYHFHRGIGRPLTVGGAPTGNGVHVIGADGQIAGLIPAVPIMGGRRGGLTQDLHAGSIGRNLHFVDTVAIGISEGIPGIRLGRAPDPCVKPGPRLVPQAAATCVQVNGPGLAHSKNAGGNERQNHGQNQEHTQKFFRRNTLLLHDAVSFVFQ